MNGQIQYGSAHALTTEATAGLADASIRLARFRHELRSLDHQSTKADLQRMLEVARELQLHEDAISDELTEIRASLDGLDLADHLARNGPPIVASDRPLPRDEWCHFVTAVRFGRRRADQIGHMELTSGWLKFHGALDVSIVWAEIAHVERLGRDILVSLVDSRRVLRFCCHTIGEAVRGAAVANYLVNAARTTEPQTRAVSVSR